MEKVFLMVEYVKEDGSHGGYTIQYTGLMSRRNIYGKLTQETGDDSVPKYIKVRKKDCVDLTNEWDSVVPRPFLHIQVPVEVGINDSRIKKDCCFSDEIKAAIELHVQENEEILAAVI